MKKRRYQTDFNRTNVRNIKIRRKLTRLILITLWSVAPHVTRRIIAGHFFKPASYPTSTEENRYIDHGDAFHVFVHHKKIQCRKWGHGPGILFVHGWNGRGIQFHHFFKPLLKAGYSVLTFDAPAHGESEGRTTNYFEFTDVVSALLERSVDLDIQGVIAHSLGASAVIHALSKADRPVRAALIAPALKLEEILYNTFNHYGVPGRIYLRLIAELEDRYGYNFHRANPFNLVEKVVSDFLMVHDRDDEICPYMDSKVLSKKYRRVDLHTTKGLGHKRILSDHTVIDHVLNYVLDRHARADGLKLVRL